jgi:hypothetical protein
MSGCLSDREHGLVPGSDGQHDDRLGSLRCLAMLLQQRFGKLQDNGRHAGFTFRRGDFTLYPQRSEALPSLIGFPCHRKCSR